jgi:hypothetical protein
MDSYELARSDQERDRGPVSPEVALVQCALEDFALERFMRNYPDPVKASADPGDSTRTVR